MENIYIKFINWTINSKLNNNYKPIKDFIYSINNYPVDSLGLSLRDILYDPRNDPKSIYYHRNDESNSGYGPDYNYNDLDW